MLFSGILVPGGFGERGIQGLILAIKWAREQNRPFLGICLGFQLAVVEWARHIVNLPGPQSLSPSSTHHVDFFAGSMSTEFVSEPVDSVVIFMPEISRTHMGGTMRLGLRPTVFQKDSEWSRIRKLYGGASVVWERHRHRYEVNPAYVERLHTSGLAFIGRDEKGERMQIMELPSKSSALPPTLRFIH
jgi:CTP synthase